MAGTLSDWSGFGRFASRGRDGRVRREDFVATMQQLGGGANLERVGMVGTGIKAGAQIGSGFAAKSAGEFEAKQYESNAADAKAAAQRARFEETTKTAKVLGKQKAIAAASGAAVASPTVYDIMDETAQRGEYLAEVETYKGDAKAEDLRNKASAARMKGKNTMTASILEGVGTAATGLSKYGSSLRRKSDDATLLDDELVEDEHDLNTNWRTKTVRKR